MAFPEYCLFVLALVLRSLIFVLRSMCLKIGLTTGAVFDVVGEATTAARLLARSVLFLAIAYLND